MTLQIRITSLEKAIICMLAILFSHSFVSAQCPTGNVSGTVTITGDCTIAEGSTITISGDLVLDGKLTLTEGAVLTVTGALKNNYVSSSTKRKISGGVVNVSSISFGNNLIFEPDNTIINVTNDVAIGYHGGLEMSDASLITGGSFTDNSQKGTIKLDHSVLKSNGTVAVGGSTNLTVVDGSTIEAGTSFYFHGGSDIDLKIENSTITTGTDFTIGEHSGSKFAKGSLITVNGNFTNENGAELTLDDAELVLTSATGHFLNGDHAKLSLKNGSSLKIAGDMVTEDQSTIRLNASDVGIAGDMNNDYYADLTLKDGSNFYIGGDFNNGVNGAGSVVNSGILNVNGSTLTVANDFNNQYGSDVDVRDGGTVGVGNDVYNGQEASIDVGDGTFYFGGTLTDPFGGVDSGSDDTDCSDGCCGTSCSLLPVSLLNFSAKVENSSVLLSWSTASEEGNDFYTISRSYDGKDFIELTTISGQGDSKSLVTYEWIDFKFSYQQVYYQLKQTDYDGTEKVLGTVVVFPQAFGTSLLTISPNPVSVGSSVKVLNASVNGGMYVLISLDGKTAKRGTIDATSSISLSGLSTGVYVLKIEHFGSLFQSKIAVE